ncbi:MAG: RNA polymerase sigma factor [Acidobacteriaceae bacterium]
MRIRSVPWDFAIARTASDDPARTAELLMNDEAFAAFYQRTARNLWAYVAKVSGNAALADDLVQESYLRFLTADLRDEGEVAYRQYLFKIATNLLRDHWRRPSMSALENLPERALPVQEAPRTDHLDQRAMLEAAFERMRPRDRQLLWLAHAESYSHREIAKITGLGETSIRLLLFRARKKLAKYLARSVERGAGR